MTSLYDEYESYVNTYKKQYGERTIVLYQCGSFYEIYSCGDGNVNIKDLCDLLNIQMSRRNKSILEVNRSNTLLAGFPEYTLNKFLNILVDNNYTVVVVSQVSAPPKPKRAVTQIISQGTRIDSNNTYESNYIMSIYIDDIDDNGISIGTSIVDLSTGCCFVGEVSSKPKDTNFSLDETYRLITIYNPKEIILFGNPGKYTFQYLITYLDITGRYVHNRLHLYPKEYIQIQYQNDFLRKIYPKHGLITPIEYIDMERMPLATVSFIMVLHFAYNHNENIVQKIKSPEQLHNNNACTISYNAIQQLNINSLISMLNTCSTACGKRFFRNRLLNPIIDKKHLEETYDGIDIMLAGKPMLFSITNKILSNIYDLERLFRRLRLQTLHPVDCLSMISSMRLMLQLIDVVINTKLYNAQVRDNVNNILNYMTHIFNENELGKYNLDNIHGSVFLPGYCSDIDNIQNELDKSQHFFQLLVSFLNNKFSDGFFKLDYNERDGFHLLITMKRFNEAKNELYKTIFTWETKDINFKNITSKNVSSSSTIIKIVHPFFVEIGSKINDLKTTLMCEVQKKYLEVLDNIDKEFNSLFDGIVGNLSYIDFVSACAANAHNQRHFRPEISSNEGGSFVIVKDIRHPIVEKIQADVQYIANDIEINEGGILLYGINSAGKSTLMKSIGISVIMAQSGMFVPCSSMTLKPYKSIYTRIPSGDDIMKGHSTFTVEVLELRNILKRANLNSLVIGDELCSGTESVSALSIVSAGIIELSKRKTSFIFATHLHNLTDISHVKNINNLKVYHLSVVYDEKKDILIYNRKLTPGQGNTLYGLEVCKSLGLGSEFISVANEVRKEILGIESFLLSSKSTKYNPNKFIGKCEICNEQCNDIHHIQEQQNADEYGFINNINKDDKFNLMCVCDSCHTAIHKEKIEINGYVQTSNGVQLSFKVNNNDVKQLKQHSDEEDRNIHAIVRDLGGIGKKIPDIIKTLQDDHHLKVSRYKINKILKQLSS